jgi:uncharacterized membrane protein YhaH (DUF805 family)
MFGIGLPELIIIAVIGIVIVLPFWKILTKAGFSGWWSLIMLIPIIGILTLFYLAFAEWPIQRELNKLKNNLK